MIAPERCINAWLSRRPDGSLRYPRTVRAHFEFIMKVAPFALSTEDIKQINDKL